MALSSKQKDKKYKKKQVFLYFFQKVIVWNMLLSAEGSYCTAVYGIMGLKWYRGVTWSAADGNGLSAPIPSRGTNRTPDTIPAVFVVSGSIPVQFGGKWQLWPGPDSPLLAIVPSFSYPVSTRYFASILLRPLAPPSYSSMFDLTCTSLESLRAVLPVWPYIGTASVCRHLYSWGGRLPAWSQAKLISRLS